MKIAFATLDDCHLAQDVVVVIDVVRAFTTAAHAFAAGAREIVLVATVEEALALRATDPEARVMGEVGGFPPEGFDFGNSPREVLGADLAGRRLIQRTGAGTQGTARSQSAGVLMAASFVCASATARYIRRLAPACVTFVITGIHGELGGDEDRACAEYLAALLSGEEPGVGPYLDRVRVAITRISARRPALHEMLAGDAEHCTAVDRFDFAMRVVRAGDLNIMTPVRWGLSCSTVST